MNLPNPGDSDHDGDSKKPALQFPLVLHDLLNSAETQDHEWIVSWLPGNPQNSFKVHDKEMFVERVLPRFFKQTHYKSFLRQLNLWGFTRIIGSDEDSSSKGGYRHNLFVKGEPDLCLDMKRKKMKKSKNFKSIQEGGLDPLIGSDLSIESFVWQEQHQQNQTFVTQKPLSSWERRYVLLGIKFGQKYSQDEFPSYEVNREVNDF